MTLVKERAVPRFPEYGTPEFSRQCKWATTLAERNCTFLVRPDPEDAEGISLWVALITQAHQLARQAECNLVFDYGEGMNISSVITPYSWNWTVPEGFKCGKHCYHWTSPHKGPRVSAETIAKERNTSVAHVPLYRYAYNLNRPNLRLYKDDFNGTVHNLPSFQPDIGMACSLGSLLRLAPDSSQFVPDLFTRILPAMHSDNSLVMSLYIRTKQADKAAEKEKKKEPNPFVEETSYRNMSLDILNCALKQEQEYLRNSTLSRVVWMVVTDSKDLKEWITETYNNHTSDIPREVIITGSRGAHSKSNGDPSLADFAEAMIDWYLIGEADMVIMDRSSVSFGGTAALRTARPVYDASQGKCTKAIPIHEGRSTHNVM